MSINKKQFYESIVKDYSRIGLWVIALFGLGVGCFLGYLIRAPIIAFLNTITAGTVFFVAGVVVLIYATIEDTRTSPAKAISADTGNEIICIGLVLILVYIIMFVISTIIIGHESDAVKTAWVNDIILSFLITSVINIVITPINLAYARCKVVDIEKPKKAGW